MPDPLIHNALAAYALMLAGVGLMILWLLTRPK